MGNEDLHWSERAKRDNPSGPPHAIQFGPRESGRPGGNGFWRGGWSRRSLARVILGLALFFALAAGGILVLHASNSAGGPTGTKSSDLRMALYEDEKAGFSFKYPSSWTREPLRSAMGNQVEPISQVAFGDPNGAKYQEMGIDFIMIAAIQAPLEFTEALRPTLAAGLERNVALMKEQVPGFEVKTPVTECILGGIRGVMAAFTATVGDRRIVSEMYFLPIGHTQYQIAVQASEQNWDANKPLFDAVLQSFRVSRTN